MTFGSVSGKPWVEALPRRGAGFAGRTFSRIHITGDGNSIPTVGEIWASPDHEVGSHAHEAPELLYVLSGEIEINDRRLCPGDTVFLPGRTEYRARVLSDGGARVLRIELPGADAAGRGPGYGSRVWTGRLTEEGLPDLRPGAEPQDP